MPNIFETSDASASTATTYSLQVGQSVQGNVSVGGDHDWYSIDLVAGQTYTFGLVGTGISSTHLHDPFLRLHDNAGNQVASNDDGGPGFNSTLSYTPTVSGTYYLDAASYSTLSTGEYTLSSVQGNRADYDLEMAAAALLRPDAAWSAPGTSATITWGVRDSFVNSVDAEGNAAPFSQLSAAQIGAVQSVLNSYSEIANVTFTQVNPGGTTNNASMLFSNYTSTTDGAGAYAYFPGTTDDAGDVRLNTQSVSTTSLPVGGYSYATIIHEVGHAMGLAHPGDYNAAPGVSITYSAFAPFINDTNQYTIMSYFDESNTTGSYGSEPDTLMLYDIYALQLQYGANITTRTGDTVYGYNATDSGSVYDFTTNNIPALSIWDAGGIDTLDASGYNGNQSISLVAGSFSDLLGLTGNVSIAFGAIIENAKGGSGNDTITGNQHDNVLIGNAGADIINGEAGDDVLEGGTGNDSLDGGFGIDTASYASDTIGVRVSLAGQNATGGSGTDTLTSIENAIGGSGNDTLIGSYLDNQLEGGAGNDVLLDLSGGNDTLMGGLGNDQLQGGAGADINDGGNGIDEVRYNNSSAAVTVDLNNNIGIGGDAAGDSYISIENVVGSAHNDIITGDAGNNRLEGYLGDDLLDGGLGADVLYGDLGFDTASYASSSVGVDVGIFRVGTGGTAEGDVMIYMEGIIGSDFDDTLVGTGLYDTRLLGGGGNDLLFDYGGNAVLDGGLGDDTLVGRLGADHFIGGAGTDTVRYASSIGAVTVDLEANSASGGDAAGDTFAGIENLVGSIFNDSLTGDAGDNRLEGGRGQDILTGGLGLDILIGGADADFFVYNTTSWGNDYIIDFANGSDLIDLRGSGLTFASFTEVATASGVRMDYNDGAATHTISILNVTTADIDAADFIF